jgi:hypothetical protein
MIYSNQYNSLKWNYKNADWKGFTNACDIKFSCNMVSDNIQETNTTLTKELINIAGDYIPVKKFNNKKWDQNCTKLVRQRNKARNRASHTGRGRISKIIKKKKNCVKKCYMIPRKNYCNSLNNNSSLYQVWYNVKKMLGNAPSKKETPTLNQNDIPMSHLLTNPTYLLKISVKSVVLTTTVVRLTYINTRFKISSMNYSNFSWVSCNIFLHSFSFSL